MTRAGPASRPAPAGRVLQSSQRSAAGGRVLAPGPCAHRGAAVLSPVLLWPDRLPARGRDGGRSALLALPSGFQALLLLPQRGTSSTGSEGLQSLWEDSGGLRLPAGRRRQQVAGPPAGRHQPLRSVGRSLWGCSGLSDACVSQRRLHTAGTRVFSCESCKALRPLPCGPSSRTKGPPGLELNIFKFVCPRTLRHLPAMPACDSCLRISHPPPPCALQHLLLFMFHLEEAKNEVLKTE